MLCPPDYDHMQCYTLLALPLSAPTAALVKKGIRPRKAGSGSKNEVRGPCDWYCPSRWAPSVLLDGWR